MKCVVRGPRGGLASADVCCDTCICANKCGLSGPKTRAWGCFDWVDIDGRRVATEKQVVDEAADLPPDVAEATMEPDPPEDIEAAIPLQRELNKLESARIDNIIGSKEERHDQD